MNETQTKELLDFIISTLGLSSLIIIFLILIPNTPEKDEDDNE